MCMCVKVNIWERIDDHANWGNHHRFSELTNERDSRREHLKLKNWSIFAIHLNSFWWFIDLCVILRSAQWILVAVCYHTLTDETILLSYLHRFLWRLQRTFDKRRLIPECIKVVAFISGFYRPISFFHCDLDLIFQNVISQKTTGSDITDSTKNLHRKSQEHLSIAPQYPRSSL